jgi:hypothetical protein
MRLTVRCPADGVVEVSVRDLDRVVVRSGSDVQATYRCPLCGSPVVVGADLAPAFIAWAASQMSTRVSDTARTLRDADLRRRTVVEREDSYVEYFRRELAIADTVEAMLALMDVGERRACGRSRTRRPSARR